MKAACISLAVAFSLVVVTACSGGSGGSGIFESTVVRLHRSCPAEQPKVADVRTANRGIDDLQKLLAPVGASRLRLCRYYGTESPPGNVGLAASRMVTDRQIVSGIARTLNGSPVPAPGGQSCPEDTGATAIGLFFYAGARPVAVQIHLSGCDFATNGFRIVGPRSMIAKEVRALTS